MTTSSGLTGLPQYPHSVCIIISSELNCGFRWYFFVADDPFNWIAVTGKNHLAAAIGNHLLSGGQSVLVVTIPDLMLRVRECYDGGQSEAALLDDLCKVDLLVLDEVGIQRGSSGEKVILNQVIDRRLSSMRPVGVLTNLNHDELLGALGARVIDRLQMDGGMWVNFDWGSYRYCEWYVDVLKAAMETPATDAFLAEVRANGADEVSAICRGLANKDGCSVNMRCSYNLTAERAEAVAAQLRKGAAL